MAVIISLETDSSAESTSWSSSSMMAGRRPCSLEGWKTNGKGTRYICWEENKQTNTHIDVSKMKEIGPEGSCHILVKQTEFQPGIHL